MQDFHEDYSLPGICIPISLFRDLKSSFVGERTHRFLESGKMNVELATYLHSLKTHALI